LGEVVSAGLDLGFDDAQQAVHDAIASFCRDRCPEAVAKAAATSFPRSEPSFPRSEPKASGEVHELWRELAELGVFAIATAEGEGGAVELVAAFEALGRAVHPGPLVETTFAMQLLPPAQRARIASGEALVSIGTPPLLPWAPLAGVFVELEGNAAWLADARGAIESVATLGGEPWGRVALARRVALGDATRAQALAQVALAAYLAAAGRRLVDAAAEHAKARRQFGRAIATFQAVSHPLADAVIVLDAAATLARVAAWEWDAQAATAGMRAAAARLSASRAAENAAHAAHQVFGALGVMRDGPAFFASRRILQLVATPPGPRPAHATLLAAAGL
jgi:alkylation response protein AidB-like acyl-CoA dehydrogenase